MAVIATHRIIVSLSAVMILAFLVACGGLGNRSKTDSPASSQPTAEAPGKRLTPKYEVQLIAKQPDWEVGFQDVDVVVTNPESTREIVRIILIGKNNSVTPPRFDFTPLGVLVWMKLSGKMAPEDVTVDDVSRNWSKNPYGGELFPKVSPQMNRTWHDGKAHREEIMPTSAKNIEMGLFLPEMVPNGKWKDQKYPHVGYNEYQVWIFNEDGVCCVDKTFKSETSSSTVTPQPKPKTTDQEEQARIKLNLAKKVLAAGKIEAAKEWLEEVIAKYPGTKAAVEAKQLLDSLNKKS